MPLPPLDPYWQTTDHKTVKLYHGDVINVLRRMPTKSVQMVVTSPPYWGLRDYGTAEWEGGDEDCDHIEVTAESTHKSSTLGISADGSGSRHPVTNAAYKALVRQFADQCGKCGAKRIDQQIGSEATPDEFVVKMVEVFRHVRRVLRDDGTLWLNLGDSYFSGGAFGHGGTGETFNKQNTNRGSQHSSGSGSTGLKPGNLIGAPWRVAFALQADGWVLRQDIIWHKPSPMPESVRNRCTKAHEYLFLLTKKGSGYFCDMDAIREPNSESTFKMNPRYGTPDKILATKDNPDEGFNTKHTEDSNVFQTHKTYLNSNGRNKRSVWTIASQNYSGAHFATFPEKLITPCILAGTSEKGCCSKCRTPWKRIVERTGYTPEVVPAGIRNVDLSREDKTRKLSGPEYNKQAKVKTMGWEAGCDCGLSSTVPCIVLDPFIGSGTLCSVALSHNRWSWGIDLSEEYLRNNAVPRIEGALLRVPNKVKLAGREVKTITGGEEI